MTTLLGTSTLVDTVLLATIGVVGLVLLLAGKRVLRPLCAVAGALGGWFIGSALQAVFFQSWPWLACAVGGAVLGALVGMLGLRLFLAVLGAWFGGILGLVVAAFAVQHGIVPASGDDAGARERAEASAILAPVPPLLGAVDGALGSGALIESAVRQRAQDGSGDSSVEAAGWLGVRGDGASWQAGIDRPTGTILVAGASVGAVVGFFGALLFSGTALAFLTSIAGSYLLLGATTILLRRHAPSVPALPPVAWWCACAALGIFGFLRQMRGSGDDAAPAQATGSDAPKGSA